MNMAALDFNDMYNYIPIAYMKCMRIYKFNNNWKITYIPPLVNNVVASIPQHDER